MNIGADAYITKPFDSEFLKARIENIFANRLKLIKYYEGVNNHHEMKNFSEDKVENKFLQELEKTILEKDLSKDIPIPELAREMGFSRSSLYRKVKAVTGMSINQFTRKVRLIKAAQLIDQGGLNVSEVAYEVGFNDQKYFRKCFKEQYGLLPSLYRKRNLIPSDSTNL